MTALTSLFASTIQSDQARMLVLFFIFLPPFFFAYWAIKRGMPATLRTIPGYTALKGLLAQAAEAGQPVHLSLGISGVGDQNTADTTAGLLILDYIAERAAISASPPIVTLANPTALPVAQDLLRRAYRRHGYPEEFDPKRARLIAPDPNLYTGISQNPAAYAPGQNDGFPYAAGTMRLLTQQPLVANVMVGYFGNEFLLLGETGAQHGLNQIGGTSNPSALPFFYATVPNPLIGEEIYAGGAYLSNKPAHISSLIAQDVMRWLLVAGMLGGVVLKTMGVI